MTPLHMAIAQLNDEMATIILACETVDVNSKTMVKATLLYIDLLPCQTDVSEFHEYVFPILLNKLCVSVIVYF